MNQYQPQILWEITRAAVSIAAWWVLFYRLHRPQSPWRRVLLLAAMPAAYALWILLPMSVAANAVSWAVIIVVFAFICGDLQRSLFTAFFYVGMEMSIDCTRSSMIAMIFGRFFTRYSPAQYIQYNLQYLFVFAVACFYYTVMKRYRDKPKISTWLLCVIPPLVLWAVMTYFIHVTDMTDPILLEQGINIYGPGFCFGLFGILLNLGILYLYINLEKKVKDRTLELEAQTAIAVQANSAKSDFLATMSHEIRTPLNAIIGLSEIELQSGSQNKINIAQIHQSGSYLLGIINEILDISKIEAGSFELVPVVYETPSFISDTVNLNLVRLGSKSIDFVLEIGGDFPFRLKGDELRVKQILNNLLSNAAKYTNEGTIILTVKSEERKEKSDEITICFTVRDTGAGIRGEDLGRLFTSYIQLDTGANRKTEGTGLGLSIAKKLVEMMGGGITVESEYGKGSVFTVEIIQGLVDAVYIGEDTAETLRDFSYSAVKHEEEIVHTRIPSGKVLVVDDVPANLLVLRGLLAPYALSIVTASSGNEAMELVKKENFDLVLLDHMMPEMDGVETAAALLAIDGFNTPIVALTANALRGMKEFYLEHGFSDYLSKPVNAQSLDEILVKWMKKGSREQGIGSRERGSMIRPDSNTPGQETTITIPRSPIPSPFNLELDAQRLDMLNHYRASFENVPEEDYGTKFDAAYFERFIALIESLGEFLPPANIDPHSLLMEAGRRGDARKIRETLPHFYENYRKHLENREKGHESDIPPAILPALKKAILDGKIEAAEAIMEEMRKANLSSAGRELYFRLYDLLLAGEHEKVLEVIAQNEIHTGYGGADD